MALNRLPAWFALLFALPACGPLHVHGSRANFDANYRNTLSRRGGFDLGCPEADLTFTPLGTGSQEGGDYTTVGVSGCGKRGTYVLSMGNWIITGSVTEGGAPAPGEQAGAGTSTTAAELTQWVMKSPDVQVLIEPRKPGGPGFGGSNISMASGPVWPPSGPSCEALVACCDQRLAEEKRYELLCPFAAVRHPGDCAGALETVNQIGAELGSPRKGACAE